MRLSLLGWMTALAVVLSAQSEDASKKTVRIQFRALSFDEAIIGAGFMQGKTVTRLDISPDFFTTEQTYMGPPQLNFFMAAEIKDNTTEQHPEIAAANSHIRELRTREAAENAELQTLLTQFQSFKNKNSEKSTSKISSYDQQQMAELQSKINEIAKRLEAIEAEITKSENIIRGAYFNQAQPKTDPKKTPGKPDGKNGKAADPATPAKPDPSKPDPNKAPANDPNKEKNREVAPPFASCTFEKSGRYILLFAKANNERRIVVMEDHEEAFPFGGIQFMNLSGTKVEIRYPEKTTALAPNEKGVVTSPAPVGSYAQADLYTAGDDGMQIGNVVRTYQQAEVRTLFFILPSPNGGHAVRLKGIEERKMPDAAPDPNAKGANGKPGAAPAKPAAK